jgi:hypothetical protein
MLSSAAESVDISNQKEDEMVAKNGKRKMPGRKVKNLNLRAKGKDVKGGFGATEHGGGLYMNLGDMGESTGDRHQSWIERLCGI